MRILEDKISIQMDVYILEKLKKCEGVLVETSAIQVGMFRYSSREVG